MFIWDRITALMDFFETLIIDLWLLGAKYTKLDLTSFITLGNLLLTVTVTFPKISKITCGMYQGPILNTASSWIYLLPLGDIMRRCVYSYVTSFCGCLSWWHTINLFLFNCNLVSMLGRHKTFYYSSEITFES